MRREPVGGVVRKDDATSPQSWWRSRGQQRAVDDLNGKNEKRPTNARAYVARRTAEGLSTKEIQRCLKRYIVRELYPLILADLADAARLNLI